MKKFLQNIVKWKKISTIKDFRFGLHILPTLKSENCTFQQPEIDGNVPNRKSFIIDIFFNFTMFCKNFFIYCVFLHTWNT
jgi:hypothetical protein